MRHASLSVIAFVCATTGCDSPRDGVVAHALPAADEAPSENEPPPSPTPRSKPAPRALTELESSLAGTWVAHVGADAPRSATMAGSVMLGMPAGEKDVVSGAMKAVENDEKISTACEWLELYENLHGFRNECALMGGEAQALNKNDPLSGAVQPFGITFTWRVEDKLVHLEYDEPLDLPSPSGNKKIKHVTLELQAGGGAKHRLMQAFPELPDVAAREVEYEILPGSYLGDPPG